MSIRILADEVVNEIAAGEIVERPSSVVRELVDNSVDAGADDVLVELEDGGTSIIRVSDNGHGMSEQDLQISLKRHATSKIRLAQDLTTISTLGFRGEALPSIASVSKLRIKTRARDAQLGSSLLVDGGKETTVEPSPVNPGTSVEVRSLFFNTPARRKFLKKPKTEELRVKQWLLQYSVGHPNVRFRLLANAKELVNLPPVDSSLQRVSSFCRGEFAELTQEFGSDLKISGSFGHPGSSSLDTSSPVFLVNGRVIQDRMLARALRDGYQSMLKPAETPVAVVLIEIEPSLVDVNVHPQKSEVRFTDSQAVFRALRSTATMALATLTKPVSQFSSDAVFTASVDNGVGGLQGEALSLNLQSSGEQGTVPASEAVSLGSVEGQFESESAYTHNEYRYLGQMLDCFLVFEKQEQMHVIDMHAAHERINYNKIRERFEDGELSSQKLLVALNVDLNEIELERLKANEVLFEKFGFEFADIGDSSVSVIASPAALRGANIVAAVREACSFDEAAAAEGALNTQIDHIAARIACHASIRSGRKLKDEEAYQLLKTINSTEFAAACPHGRPVSVVFSRKDIEKWFGRDA